jgi:hypothetical protein
MPADWDSSTSQGAVDTASVSETSTATDDSGWESYPDYASSEGGNTPEVAQLNQGNPDSPNGWGDYDPADYDQYDDQDNWGDYGETAGSSDDEPDPWGDTYPDAANYADLDSVGTSSPDGRQGSIREDKPAADAGIDAAAAQPDQDQAAVENSEHALSPEQQRIAALEAENADARQQIADSGQRITELEAEKDQQTARLDEQATRLDRIEKLLTGSDTSPDQQGAQDAARPKFDGAIANRENSDESTITKDARRHGWRHAVSSERLGIISALGGAAQAVGEFAVHATPEGTVGLGLTAVGVAQVLRARAEKKAERKDKV